MKKNKLILVNIMSVLFIGGCGLTTDSYRPVDDISREMTMDIYCHVESSTIREEMALVADMV